MLKSVSKFWRGIIDRMQDAFRDGTRQRITTAGLGFILFILVVGAAAFVSGNNLLFLLFAALLATFLISGFISRLGLAGLQLELEAPDQLTAGRDILAGVQVRNRKWLFPSFSLQLSGDSQTGFQNELTIPMIPGGATVRQSVVLHFDRRGAYRDNTFFFASRFPFGFTHRRAEVRLKDELLVCPSVEPQPSFEQQLEVISDEVEARTRGLGTDFYRVRPYEPLESARHLDWRATAHTGDLQVREFIQEQHNTVTLILDRHFPARSADWEEVMIDFAAFVIASLASNRVTVHFLTQGFERSIPGNADAYDILKFLATAEPSGRPCPSPPDDNSVQIAITIRPELASFGMDRLRIVSCAELEPARAARASRSGQAGPGPNIHNGNGKD